MYDFRERGRPLGSHEYSDTGDSMGAMGKLVCPCLVAPEHTGNKFAHGAQQKRSFELCRRTSSERQSGRIMDGSPAITGIETVGLVHPKSCPTTLTSLVPWRHATRFE